MENKKESTENPPLLSVIIPVYNVEKYIERCLNSLMKINVENEIILVNDGSEDSTMNIINDFLKKNSKKNINIFSQKNSGQSSARNLGIRKAKGKYISFIDSDDFVEPSEYNKFIKKTLERNLDLSLGNFKFHYGKDNLENRKKFNGINLENKEEGTGIDWMLSLYGYFSVEPWNKLYRRRFLTENSLFFKEGRVHEDVIFVIEAFLKAQRVKYFDICFYNYYQNNKNSTMNNIKEKNYYDMLLNIREIARYKIEYGDNPELEKFLNELIYHFFNEMMEKTYKKNNKVFKDIQKEYRKIFKNYGISKNMSERLKRKARKLAGVYSFVYYNKKLNKVIKNIKKGVYDGSVRKNT